MTAGRVIVVGSVNIETSGRWLAGASPQTSVSGCLLDMEGA